ncbi:MAG: hypothetical protein BWZ10_00875 [candidate division BRC1 bacterium ADurb.BinA364]|nr:MAG: hypothetical protein BWZ10_00875 [candidate division BRC1 bacterium ADurb.BinA364]
MFRGIIVAQYGSGPARFRQRFFRAARRIASIWQPLDCAAPADRIAWRGGFARLLPASASRSSIACPPFHTRACVSPCLSLHARPSRKSRHSTCWRCLLCTIECSLALWRSAQSMPLFRLFRPPARAKCAFCCTRISMPDSPPPGRRAGPLPTPMEAPPGRPAFLAECLETAASAIWPTPFWAPTTGSSLPPSAWKPGSATRSSSMPA